MVQAILEIRALKKNNASEAQALLRRVAAQVKPIMTKRGWQVKKLHEFYPKNPNLLGCNVNRGHTIRLRLRQHYDDKVFIDYESVLMTMLHELTHIVHGPHDQSFYALLDELTRELEVLLVTHAVGEGQRLGGRQRPASEAKQTAVAAAEKRRQLQRIMLPAGGVRLGGATGQLDTDRHLTPAQKAAQAAERRRLDQIWCGGDMQQEQSASASMTDPIVLDDDEEPESRQRKRTKTETPLRTEKDAPSKRQRAMEEPEADNQWPCPSCTFHNPHLVLMCQMCYTEKPWDVEADLGRQAIESGSSASTSWVCPQCTLENEAKWWMCTACEYVNRR